MRDSRVHTIDMRGVKGTKGTVAFGIRGGRGEMNKITAKPTRAEKLVGSDNFHFKISLCEQTVSSKTNGTATWARLRAHHRIYLEGHGVDAQTLLAKCISIVTGTTADVLINSLGLSGKYPRGGLEARSVLKESQELEVMAAVEEFAGLQYSHC